MLLFLSLSILVQAKTIQLDEAKLIEIARSNPPQRQQLELEKLSKKSMYERNELNYQPYLTGSASYAKTDEEALIPFAPPISPQHQLSVGLERRSPHGYKYSASVFAEQLSVESLALNRATQTGVKASVEMDLLQNWMGRLDAAKRRSLTLDLEKSESYNTYRSHQFEFELRKLYWQWIANERSTKLTRELKASAAKQLSDLQDRARLGVSSRGDVSRARALLEARNTTLLLLSYEKLQLKKALKTQLPALQGAELILPEHDYGRATKDVLFCIQKINNFDSYQADWTTLSRVLASLDKQLKSQLTEIDSIARTQLNLQAGYQLTNADDNYGESLSGERNSGYSAALVLSVPLGGSDDRARQSERALAKAGNAAEKRLLNAQLKAEHDQINMSLEILTKGLAAQERNNKHLSQSVADMERKFRQARVGLNNLILEQESHFNSQIREIDIKLQVILALMDYFKTFDRFPCKLNHARAES